jgi:ABC-type Mn2+/Zn2+ transport system permease subunit
MVKKHTKTQQIFNVICNTDVHTIFIGIAVNILSLLLFFRPIMYLSIRIPNSNKDKINDKIHKILFIITWH